VVQCMVQSAETDWQLSQSRYAWNALTSKMCSKLNFII